MKPIAWVCAGLALAWAAQGLAAEGRVTATFAPDGDRLISCLEDPAGRRTRCDVSAVAYADGRLIFAEDRSEHYPSPVFTYSYRGADAAPAFGGYVAPDVLKRLKKIEGLAVLPGAGYLVATTAFDRPKPPYNLMAVWPLAGGPARIVETVETADGPQPLRDAFRQVFEPRGWPHFKIEGLAALPGRLLFGLREVGKDWKHPQFGLVIVAMPYGLEQGRLVLGPVDRVYAPPAEDWRAQLRRVPGKRPPFDKEKKLAKRLERVGLSGLDYDAEGGRLLLLTSYEAKDAETLDDHAAFLWTLPLADFEAGRPPRLVTTPDGAALQFDHKAEGLARIDARHLFVVHDDDKVTETGAAGGRKAFRVPSQAAYDIVVLD